MKNKFLKSTFILLIGGLITKILGMIIRIIMNRLMSTSGIGAYMLIMPTFGLLIAISQFSFPTSISKIVSSNKANNKKLLFSVLPFSFILNLILMLFCLFCSKYIAINLLHEKKVYLGLKVMGFVLPFISISSILRGYFFGKQKMFPHVLSNIIEDIIRLIVIIIGIPITIKYGLEYCIMFLILSTIISELTSIFILLLFIPNRFNITREVFIHNRELLSNIMEISIPTTFSRIIGNIGYFFEPIIFTNVLLSNGFSNNFIVSEYGIINAYVMSLLLLPSFFSNAISQSIIPVVSSSFSNGNYKILNNRIKQGILLSFCIGLFITIIFLLFGDFLLKFIYDTNKGINYLKVLNIPFILFYIEGPIISILQAMGYSKETLKTTIYGVILKLFSIIILCKLFNVWGYIYATIINIVFVTLYNFRILKKKTISLR